MNKSVKEEDILFLFVRYYDEAFQGKEIEQAEATLCGQLLKALDDRFAYVPSSNDGHEDSNEEGDDEIFDHEDEDDGTVDKLDDIDRVLLFEGQ